MAGESTGFGARDWATIISGLSQGTQQAIGGAAQYAGTQKEAKEAKRRTIADLLNRAMKRNVGLYRAGQEYSDEGADYRSQVMQQVASNMINSLKGTTSGGRR